MQRCKLEVSRNFISDTKTKHSEVHTRCRSFRLCVTSTDSDCNYPISKFRWAVCIGSVRWLGHERNTNEAEEEKEAANDRNKSTCQLHWLTTERPNCKRCSISCGPGSQVSATMISPLWPPLWIQPLWFHFVYSNMVEYQMHNERIFPAIDINHCSSKCLFALVTQRGRRWNKNKIGSLTNNTTIQ